MKHSFEVELALKYGVIGAVMFDVIALALKQDNEYMVRKGKRWVPFGCSDIARLMPYISPGTVQAVARTMRKDGLLEAKSIVGNSLLYYTIGENGEKYLGGNE